MYDLALLREQGYQQRVADRWANGPDSPDQVFQKTIELLQDPKIGPMTLEQIQFAIDWFEQLNDEERCNRIVSALRAASESIVHRESAEFARQMVEKLEQRLAARDQPLRFQQTTIDGQSITQKNFADRFVVVYFWSSRNQASMDATQQLARVVRELKGKGVFVIAVSTDQDFEQPCLELAQRCDDWYIIGGESGPDSILEFFPISTVPHILLTDRSGKIRESSVAVDEVQTRLETLINSTSAGTR